MTQTKYPSTLQFVSHSSHPTTSQIIHLCPSHKHLLANCGPYNTPIIQLWPQSWPHFSPDPPMSDQSPRCGNTDPSPDRSLWTPHSPYTTTCQAPASHVHHWVMDEVEGRHPTLQSSLIPSAMQTPPNHTQSFTEIICLGRATWEKNGAFKKKISMKIINNLVNCTNPQTNWFQFQRKKSQISWQKYYLFKF